MSKVKKSVLSVEVYKYPYYGRLDDTEGYLSNKICCGTIKIRKKFLETVKLLIFYGDPVVRLRNSVTPSQAIGIPIPPPIIRMRSIQLNDPLSKKEIIAQVSKEMSSKIVFTETEMDQLYDLSVKYKDNAISQEDLLTEISNLRGGSDVEVAAFLVILATITLLMASSSAFPLNPNRIIPPHLQWMYGNQQPGNQYGYGKGVGPRSITVVDATQNAGSEKNDPSFGSYDYDTVMDNLASQGNKKRVNISAGDQSYTLENPLNLDAYGLSDILSEKMYDSIRDSDTDIYDIAKNVGYKPENLKKIKDHVFYNEHKLDRYLDLGHPVEYGRFDPDLKQALAWKRLQSGIHNENDIIWLKHEYREQHHELKYDSGYSEAHNRAQKVYNGRPWDTKWN